MFRAFASASSGSGSSGPRRETPASFSAKIRAFQTRSNSRSPTFIGRKWKRLPGKYRSKGSLFHSTISTAKVVTGSGGSGGDTGEVFSLSSRYRHRRLGSEKARCYLHALRSIRQSPALAACYKLLRSDVARSALRVVRVQIISTRRRRCSVRSRSQLSASSVISKCFE